LRRVAEDPDKAEALRRFEESLELVEKLARQVGKVVGSAVELDDLLSFGREGLLDASRRFDVTRGVPFRAYASYRVRGAIYDGVRQMSRLPRRAHERLNGLAAAAGVSEGALEDVSAGPVPGADKAAADAALAEHLASLATAMAVGLVAETVRSKDGTASLDPTLDPEEAYASAELLEVVKDAIADLPREEAELVRRHYLEGERFDRVATDLGLSKSWASRLHTRAMGRLSKRLRNAT
jgi:RNA polymerase sigma factor for flagellar operon FliA